MNKDVKKGLLLIIVLLCIPLSAFLFDLTKNPACLMIMPFGIVIECLFNEELGQGVFGRYHY